MKITERSQVSKLRFDNVSFGLRETSVFLLCFYIFLNKRKKRKISCSFQVKPLFEVKKKSWSRKWALLALNHNISKHPQNWDYIQFLVDFPFELMWVVNPKGQSNPLSFKNEKSEISCNCFQVIVSVAFPYWKPIVLDWFPWETCQFSFIFQFATASAQAHSLCWIIKRLFSWPLPRFPTANLWSCCQINHRIYWYDTELWQLSDRDRSVHT